jgi:hypothetical protein
LTFRELYWMADARQRAEWERTSWLLAQRAGKSPAEINPYSQTSRTRPAAIGVGELRAAIEKPVVKLQSAQRA